MSSPRPLFVSGTIAQYSSQYCRGPCTVRGLELDGLVSRQVFDTPPPPGTSPGAFLLKELLQAAVLFLKTVGMRR